MKIKLIDSTFAHENSIGYAGENSQRHPEFFRWSRVAGWSPIKVFTDIRLKHAFMYKAKRKIGLLVESPAVARESFKEAMAMREYFHAIFTHNRQLVETGHPFIFYPLGGSWLKRWGMFPKKRLVSILTSDKTKTEGQQLRHEIIERFGYKLDVFGEPYTLRLIDKAPALRDYCYSIIVENGKEDWYFSEKLIDCISQGTIPIYWGCPSIGSFFIESGILQFDNLDELDVILNSLSSDMYDAQLESATGNLDLADGFKCPEDWIWKHYQEIFTS